MLRGSQRQLGYRAFQVKRYVETVIAKEGVAPSYRMIGNELGISTKGEVCRIVSGLEKRGILSRVGKGRIRRIRLGV